MKLTEAQKRVYNSLSYEWQSLKELQIDKVILGELVSKGLVEKLIHSYYRRTNKRIMVG